MGLSPEDRPSLCEHLDYPTEETRSQNLGEISGLGEQAARRIEAIRQKCPEDFDALARRLEALVAAG